MPDDVGSKIDAISEASRDLSKMSRRSEKIFHRHTVPNSDYSAFPCYQEEIKLKTNLIGYETNNDFDNDNCSNQEKFEVNVSMHDKLKMCFAEMETVKSQFDTRRRKIQTKKKHASQQSHQPESSSVRSSASESDPAKLKPKPPDKESTPSQTDTKPPAHSKTECENRFKAHLIRTSSKDSIEDILKNDKDKDSSDPDLSNLPSNKETIVVQTTLPHLTKKPNSKPNIRAVSDPFDNLRLKKDSFESMHRNNSKAIYGDGSFKFEPYNTLQFDWATSSSDNKIETRKKDLGVGEDDEDGEEDDSGEQRIKNMQTRKSYDQWLQKLDNINDMSRSTINRIKKLENEMSNLKLTTVHSPLTKNAKQPQSKIPVTVRPVPANILSSGAAKDNTFIVKKYEDKSTNTDIDLRFMTELLSRWKSKQCSSTQTPEETADNRRIRRLTTVIKRAVDIATTKVDKESSTDDNYTHTASTDISINQNTNAVPKNEMEDLEKTARQVPNQDPLSTAPKSQSIAPPPPEQSTIDQPDSPMSLLDLPNIETTPIKLDYSHSGFDNLLPTKKVDSDSISIPLASKPIKTPEPIIEMYSDTDDFDNFEKSIYNEISRRAAISNRIVNKKLPTTKKTSIYDELDRLQLRNSATQTYFESETLPKNVMENNEPETCQSTKTNPFKKNLQSTSKITIERTRLNQKDKSEIVLKTSIDKEGKLHRTTEVKNRKFKPKENRQKNARKADLIQLNNNHLPNSEYLRKVNSTSDINIYHTNNQFSRPLSAIDITDDGLMKKQNDDFISNKALSSVDLCSKSPAISEGYYSEYLDSHNRITPHSEYLIEPPVLFQGEPGKNGDWEEFSKSEISNKTVNEIAEPLTGFDLDNNLLTLTNETLIDNNGKQTNITTTSKTIRKYKPRAKTTSTLDLTNNCNMDDIYGDMDKSMDQNHSVSQCNLNELKPLGRPNQTDQPMFYDKKTIDNYNRIEQNQSEIANQDELADHHPNVCNFSLVYNYGNNVIFRANFGIAKLPCLETNL